MRRSTAEEVSRLRIGREKSFVTFSVLHLVGDVFPVLKVLRDFVECVLVRHALDNIQCRLHLVAFVIGFLRVSVCRLQ